MAQSKVEAVTEWRRLNLDSRPHSTILSYERGTELRDFIGVPARKS